MYWTAHIRDHDILRIRCPLAFVGETIYAFGFSEGGGESDDEAGPMEVYMMNTKNFELTAVPADDTTPLRRFRHTAVVHKKKIYMWGGESGWDLYPELLCFDTETLTWTKLATTGSPPVSCLHHSSFVIDHTMYVLGGLNEPGAQFSQEIFTLDLETLHWGQLVTEGAPVFDIGMWVCAIGYKVYVFRGQSHYTTWNDVSCLDMQTLHWDVVEVSGWYPRLTYSAVFSHSGSIYVFGGRCRISKMSCNDLWKFSPDAKRWRKIKPAGRTPLPRHLSTCVVGGNMLFLFGGIVNNSEMSGCLDLHVLDFTPSLRTLCLMVVVEHNLNLSSLPQALISDAVDMSGASGVKYAPLGNTSGTFNIREAFGYDENMQVEMRIPPPFL